MKIDNLGRIVIPKIMRDKLGLSENNKLDIFLDGDRIIITNAKNNDCIERIKNKLDEAKKHYESSCEQFWLGYIDALEWLLEEKSELNN